MLSLGTAEPHPILKVEFSMTTPNIALVVGASGIIGNAVVQTLAGQQDWTVRALRSTAVAGVESIDCDLANPAEVAQALRAAADTTHVFYAAYKPAESAALEASINTAMLAAVLDGLKAVAAPLRRVVHYQGAKVYGPHLGAAVAPFYEDDVRHLAPNFYFDQEDLLRERAAAGDFDWSILRPDAVIGDIGGNPMNIAVVIGAFAALSKHAGLPLRFPGSMKTYRGVLGQLTDARWLGRASVWAALSDNARNEAFNLVGEPFRWERIWKRVGAALDIEVAAPQPMSLATHMPEQAAQWQRLAARHDLQAIPYPKLVNWFFGDVVFNIPWDMVSDMGKIRRAGFTEAVSTEDALVNAILSLKLKGIIP
jgi:nucleoside-diphosphate-sugar epimerase